MKHLFTILMSMIMAASVWACSDEDDTANTAGNAAQNVENENTKPSGGNTQAADTAQTSQNNQNNENGNAAASGKTVVVFYSYTGNSRAIATEIASQAGADLLEIEPQEENLDYAANNYAIGSAQVGKIKDNPASASSYPAIKEPARGIGEYSTIIIVTPLWWSQMAAPMQSYLFHNGAALSGKTIGLAVSSASSGISGVEADAKRLVPSGRFMAQSLWINSGRFAQRASLVKDWLSANFPKQSTENQSSISEMKITINNTTMTAVLSENASAKALAAQLAKGDITYEAHDYGDFEKVGDLGVQLPQTNEQITTRPGDIILYQGKSLCIYYGQNSWSFTRIGRIEGVSEAAMREFVKAGGGNVLVRLGVD